MEGPAGDRRTQLMMMMMMMMMLLMVVVITVKRVNAEPVAVLQVTRYTMMQYSVNTSHQLSDIFINLQ